MMLLNQKGINIMKNPNTETLDMNTLKAEKDALFSECSTLLTAAGVDADDLRRPLIRLQKFVIRARRLIDQLHPAALNGKNDHGGRIRALYDRDLQEIAGFCDQARALQYGLEDLKNDLSIY